MQQKSFQHSADAVVVVEVVVVVMMTVFWGTTSSYIRYPQA